MVRVIEYEDKYAAEFKSLNMEWLEKYNLLEQHDLDILDHPREEIINRGGYIFLAVVGNEIAGTGALDNMGNHVFELVKMSVKPGFRGKGIGKALLQHCITQARAAGAGKLVLYSNSQLKTAVNMYEQFGFKHVDVTDSPFVTADIKMELSL